MSVLSYVFDAKLIKCSKMLLTFSSYSFTFIVSVSADALVVYCFSCCWYERWAGWVNSCWRPSVWRQNREPVTTFASRRFSRSNTTQGRWAGWTVTWFGLTYKTACGGACQQPCSLLHLYDVGSTHESAWSVAQSATQRHCPGTLYFPLRCHSNSPCQETCLASDRISTKSGILQFCSK